MGDREIRRIREMLLVFKRKEVALAPIALFTEEEDEDALTVEEEDARTATKKLLHSIELVEKIGMAEILRLKSTPLAQKQERDKRCSDLDTMDKKPSKIMWEVPWEELMAKAGSQRPSHLILHLKNFQKSESFARVIKCSVPEESDVLEHQAVRICSVAWRNCLDDYMHPVSIWHPRAPEGFVSPGCVAVASFNEPEPNTVYCMPTSLSEQTEFEEQKLWSSPDSYPWACHIYQVRSDALHFMALRQSKEESDWRAIRVRDDYRSIEFESARNLRIE